MIAVIFEVEPADAGSYLAMAEALGPLLTQVDGFISVERFQSLASPNKLLSLSFWRDEQALAAWRNAAEHRQAQARGRNGALQHYRLRIAPVERDYGMRNREEAPADSRAVHEQIAQDNSLTRNRFGSISAPGPVAPNGDQPICKDGR
jgi:heme-degrading monooxygenase HmoA